MPKLQGRKGRWARESHVAPRRRAAQERGSEGISRTPGWILLERKAKYFKGLALNVAFSPISRHGVRCRPCPWSADLSMPHRCLLVAPASPLPPHHPAMPGQPLGQGLGVPGGILATVKISPSLPFSPLCAAMYIRARGGAVGNPAQGGTGPAIMPRCPLPRIRGPPPHSGSLRGGPQPLALMACPPHPPPPTPPCAGPQPPPPSARQPPPETPQQTHLQSCPAPKTTP